MVVKLLFERFDFGFERSDFFFAQQKVALHKVSLTLNLSLEYSGCRLWAVQRHKRMPHDTGLGRILSILQFHPLLVQFNIALHQPHRLFAVLFLLDLCAAFERFHVLVAGLAGGVSAARWSWMRLP